MQQLRKQQPKQCDFYPCTSTETTRYMVSGKVMAPAVRDYCDGHRELVKAAGLTVGRVKVQGSKAWRLREVQ